MPCKQMARVKQARGAGEAGGGQAQGQQHLPWPWSWPLADWGAQRGLGLGSQGREGGAAVWPMTILGERLDARDHGLV